MPRSMYVEMDGDAKIPEVLHAEDGRNDVAAEVVKDEHLPYRLSVLVKDRIRRGEQTVRGSVGVVFWSVVVEV